MLVEGDSSAPLKSALAGTELDLRSAAPEAAAALRDALGVLSARAQAAGAARADLDAEDLMALIAGTFRTLQHAGVGARSKRAARLTTVIFDGLAAGA